MPNHDATNNPCEKALNDLWRDIILKRHPNYGDWEYPGQAYRHILAEFEDAVQAARGEEREATIEECAEVVERRAADADDEGVRGSAWWVRRAAEDVRRLRAPAQLSAQANRPETPHAQTNRSNRDVPTPAPQGARGSDSSPAASPAITRRIEDGQPGYLQGYVAGLENAARMADERSEAKACDVLAREIRAFASTVQSESAALAKEKEEARDARSTANSGGISHSTPPAQTAKPLGPNHKDGCDGSSWSYSGSGYNRVRLCACGAEDHEAEVLSPAPPATSEPDVFAEVAREMFGGNEVWQKWVEQLAALLRARFGECVEALERIGWRNTDPEGSAMIARSALSSLRAGREQGA